MPLPIKTGAPPVGVPDDDLLTAKAIEKQTTVLQQLVEVNRSLLAIQTKQYELDAAEAKREQEEKQAEKKAEKKDEKRRKTCTVNRDREGYITGMTMEEC